MWESIKENISKYSLLTHEETLQLFSKIREGDLSAREKVLNHNLRLVAKIVDKYKGVYDMDDLFQIGSIGLLKAIDGFDSSLDTKFSTYAVPKILGEIKMYFRDNNPIKLSRQQVSAAKQVRDAQEKLIIDLGRNPKISEIADFLNIPIEEVVMAMESNQSLASLEQPLGEDSDYTLKDQLADNTFDEYFNNKLLLKEILSSLGNIERKIIILRYFKEQSQQQIANALNISQVQVSRIEKKIISRLKESYNKV